jgi:hypothetical protein
LPVNSTIRKDQKKVNIKIVTEITSKIKKTDEKLKRLPPGAGNYWLHHIHGWPVIQDEVIQDETNGI